jgi:hypothetical protein
VDRIGRAEELELATRKPDGSLSVFTTMWVVGVGTALDLRRVVEVAPRENPCRPTPRRT